VRGLLLFLFGAAFPLAGYLVVVHPERTRALQAAEARLLAREKEAQALAVIADRLPEFRRDQQELQERLTQLKTIRPPSTGAAALVGELRGLAADAGLARVSVEELAAAAESDTLPIRLAAEGSQPELVALLGRLSRTTRLLRLERVELERLGKERYALALRLCAFREKPSS
jgi:Tfp pilus assembly protein PilO